MVDEGNVQPASDALFCTVHPTVETTLRCNKCGRPMCTRCAVRTPVGYRCKECVRGQQNIFYNAQPLDPFLQSGISLVLSGATTAVFSLIGLGFGFLGWLIAFWAGSAIGALTADLAHRAVGRRRGRYSWLFVAGAVVMSGLLVSLILGFTLANLIFVVMATSGAVGRLRLGR